MVAAGSRDDELVIKSPNDQRSYRLLRLANGLSALLVHDPEIYAEEMQEEEGEDDEESDEDDVGYSGEEGDDDDGEDEDVEWEEEGEENGSEPKKVKGGAEPLVKKAAAAMCVGIGSFADPPKAQGLAHFLEHMLFMGSSEFPDENEVRTVCILLPFLYVWQHL